MPRKLQDLRRPEAYVERATVDFPLPNARLLIVAKHSKAYSCSANGVGYASQNEGKCRQHDEGQRELCYAGHKGSTQGPSQRLMRRVRRRNRNRGPRLRPYGWAQPRQRLRAKLRRQDEHQFRREPLFWYELIDGHNP